MRRILSNITILNLMLFALVLSFSYYLYFYSYKGVYGHSLIRLPAQIKQEAKADATAAEPVEEKPLSPLDYSIISDKNLFHPERKIPPEKKAVVELPKPEFILYGTLISGDTGIAYVEDKKAPKNTPGRGKRQNALKIGQTISGFTLKEIYEDRVVFIRGEERMEVKVIDNNIKKQRELPAKTPPPKEAAKIKQ